MSARTEAHRIDDLVAAMTLEEKLAQLVGLWEGRGGDGADGDVAPMQDAMQSDDVCFEEFARHGLGQLTRPFGTAPVDPDDGRRAVAGRQRWLQQNTRFGIPALVHEECLTGLAAWRATAFPAPPAWGASFDPTLVGQMAAATGTSMRALGVHQGLAPVLDVVRDPRWGRVEECISEDPWLVGEVATAYVRGLQSSDVAATLKHFVGYSASRAGRNLAPVHAGVRELADVLLVPFEMALLDGGAASVMNSYAEIDGVPVAADAGLLTDLLRGRWGFTGTTVSDYFAVAFLHTLHGVAEDLGDAAAQALEAGIDVELPTGNTYLAPLAAQVRSGRVAEDSVDRALRRVLEHKQTLGLLDPDWQPEVPATVDVDPPEHRELAARLAEESVVLLSNDGTLPLAETVSRRIAVVGPNADSPSALFGGYSFVNHVLPQHPGVDLGLDVRTVLDALDEELVGADVVHARGCDVRGEDLSGIAAAVEMCRSSDVAVCVVGDRAGLFGRGTSGEGCDTQDLELPGAQRRLVEELVATGTPVVLVLLTGRPYAVDWALRQCACVVQAFFPGQEGGPAVAGVLSGRVNPSGRLPVTLPRSVGAQPYSYLRPRLGGPSSVSNLDNTPALPFGHGMSYTAFGYDDLVVQDPQVPTGGRIVMSCRVTNTGPRTGSDVVQVYATDEVASVTRPVVQLLGHARVQDLAPGESVRVELDVPTTRLALTDRRGLRVVEPGDVAVTVSRSCAEPVLTTTVTLVGKVHEVTTRDRRTVITRISR